MTEGFLVFSKAMGNDLTTPQPALHFSGLGPGVCWCLCLSRWVEAFDAGLAPPVVLEATHTSVGEFIYREVLERHAWRSESRE
jgi:uncharacterized protein (DUF2237 family)